MHNSVELVQNSRMPGLRVGQPGLNLGQPVLKLSWPAMNLGWAGLMGQPPYNRVNRLTAELTGWPSLKVRSVSLIIYITSTSSQEFWLQAYLTLSFGHSHCSLSDSLRMLVTNRNPSGCWHFFP